MGKNGKSERTVLQLVLVNETGDSYYRMRWPGSELSRKDSCLRVVNLAANAQERFDWALEADLLVLFQSQDYDLLPVLEERRRRGMKTLVEYNDNFYAPQPWSPVAGPWTSPLTWQAYESFINGSDGVIVTGRGLVELFRGKTSTPIHVLPNHLPAHFELQTRRMAREPNDQLRLGWAGSMGHMADILALAPMIERLLSRNSKLRFHIMGNEALPNFFRVPKQQLRFHPWGTMEDYYNFWREVDLGIAPLIDTAYNRCRSDIKAVEMIGNGVLPLCQKLGPYLDLSQETPVPLFTNHSDLETQINGFIQDPERIEKLFQPLQTYVQSNRLEQNRSERLELYSRYIAGTGRTAQMDTQQDDPAAGRESSSGTRFKSLSHLSVGYHELDGTSEAETPSSVFLKHIQLLWNENRKQEALQSLQAGLQRNPANPDWELGMIKITGIVDKPVALSRINHSLQRFPRDLRILTVATRMAPDASTRVHYWETLLDRIQRDNVAAKFFRREIIEEFTKQARITGELQRITAELLLVYPESSELLYLEAERCEASGETQKALEIFSKLLERQEQRREEGQFIESIDSGYLSAWVETLKSRDAG